MRRRFLSSVGAALVIAVAYHSLEVEGDVLATIDSFRLLAEAVLDFLGRAPR